MLDQEKDLLEKVAAIEPAPKKRNFVVFFHCKALSFHGYYNSQTEGGYVRNFGTRGAISDHFGFKSMADVQITNIIELNESDFNDWIS